MMDMAAIEHKYPVVVNWSGARDGKGDITPQTSGKTIPINVPEEFGGQGGDTNPEELLTSAITGCYSITFGIVAANRKLPILNLVVAAEGVVEQNGAAFKYKQIVIRPTITLATDATDDQMKIAEDMAHKCDAYCIVTNAVRASVEVIVEPTLVRA
jgi:peroxiredoxin-like protein